MEFKDWLLLNEKAERTSAKVPLYPPLYHTKQYGPLLHTLAAADYPVWLELKLKSFTWNNFQSIFGHEKIPKPDWPKVGENIPSHHHTEMNDFKWEIPKSLS
jgi:hypothetical protein